MSGGGNGGSPLFQAPSHGENKASQPYEHNADQPKQESVLMTRPQGNPLRSLRRCFGDLQGEIPTCRETETWKISLEEMRQRQVVMLDIRRDQSFWNVTGRPTDLSCEAT